MSGDRIPAQGGDLIIHPIQHATFVLGWKGTTIYVDPVGAAGALSDLPKPDLVLITDIHGDHLDARMLGRICGADTCIVAPAEVVQQLSESLRAKAKSLKNGDTTNVGGIRIEAVPMYNLTQDRLRFHSKGRGNGYVLELGGKRLYISGDTEDIPEMRSLKSIDVAFLCMNLPYTMTVQQAADAVRAFRPKIVYPYHYRGSDVEEFKRLVGEAAEVRLRDWYP
jgi:L-ascorbate metabolism protein UlaG (beta-lactamase superfamily)